MYHFYCLFTNTTTIEGWEKDKVARLIKRGKIKDVRFIILHPVATTNGLSGRLSLCGLLAAHADGTFDLLFIGLGRQNQRSGRSWT